jgi:hypothetical protein
MLYKAGVLTRISLEEKRHHRLNGGCSVSYEELNGV